MFRVRVDVSRRHCVPVMRESIEIQRNYKSPLFNGGIELTTRTLAGRATTYSLSLSVDSARLHSRERSLARAIKLGSKAHNGETIRK